MKKYLIKGLLALVVGGFMVIMFPLVSRKQLPMQMHSKS